MRCNNCQTEWNDNGKFTDIKNCPFCGKMLHNDKIIIDDNASFSSVLKEIEKRCGKEIWKDRAKAVSVFRDLAPKMKKERILLVLALECQIQDIFEREKDFAVNKAKIRLQDSLGDHPIEDILAAFSELYNIESNRKQIKTVDTENAQYNKTDKKYDNTKSEEYKDKTKNVSASKEKTVVQTVGKSNIKTAQSNSFANLKVGDIFEFGKYNGRKIKWKVLEKDSDSFYVISKEILCKRAFNNSDSNNWLVSGLRKWLNGDFYNSSFSTDEKTKIKTEDSDIVTLLSKEEAEKLMTKEERSLCAWWWLRSLRSRDGSCVWAVHDDGGIHDSIYYIANGSGGVRPALHLYYKIKKNNNYDNIKPGEDKTKNAITSKEKTLFHTDDKSKNKNVQSDSFADLKVGDILEFGEFNDRKIKWEVLEKVNSSIYVVSTEILCQLEFNSNLSNDWLESKLKKWLNDDFYNSSFSANEKTIIKADIADKVTLLSKEEAERLTKKKDRQFGCCWWLRSPYDNSSFVWCVNDYGDIGCSFADGINGVRPALNLTFSKTHDIEYYRTIINIVDAEKTKDNNFNTVKNNDEIKLISERFKLKNIARKQITADGDNNQSQSASSLAELKVGDTFNFGEYAGRKMNWKVLEKDNSSIYVISTEILCEREFNSNLSNNWLNSELRRWLNVDFYNASFSPDDKIKIETVNLDKVTLLSKEEVERLMTKVDRILDTWWWLRSPHFDYGSRVCYVFSDGDIYGCNAGHSGGVRPALHLYY